MYCSADRDGGATDSISVSASRLSP
jgi:hypothetical protein